MKICKNCKKEFSTRVIIEGKKRNISNRRYCLECSPFGKHNTRILEPDRKRNSSKGEGKKKICIKCNNDFVSYANRNICGTCKVTESRRKKKRLLVEYKGGNCKICGYKKCQRSLSFHHLNPEIKESTISHNSWGLERCKKEVDKCILVCSNCHGEIHEGIIEINDSVA